MKDRALSIAEEWCILERKNTSENPRLLEFVSTKAVGIFQVTSMETEVSQGKSHPIKKNIVKGITNQNKANWTYFNACSIFFPDLLQWPSSNIFDWHWPKPPEN